VQCLMGFREPIVMISQGSRPKVGELAQRIVDRKVPGWWRARYMVRRQIFDLTLVRLGHGSSGSKALSEFAALRGGF
jgi:hypothetical protein